MIASKTPLAEWCDRHPEHPLTAIAEKSGISLELLSRYRHAGAHLARKTPVRVHIPELLNASRIKRATRELTGGADFIPIEAWMPWLELLERRRARRRERA